ncbi:PREDICTED: F-box protein PP2-B15-like [Ipomoea nil]|uniref:F-box protein PP2-B15-like n=1 Tax=Ipomoea nil TaxID=35883 RepID=UPI00090102B7|nr:PREDICTED: F-box protein PP2-B15-like [Ipomoea nil]
MEPFARLPEACVAEIISFTSPEDAARSAVVSAVFKSAADSDVVWDKFLPSDYQSIISRSLPPPIVYATKKDLYLALCHSPILLDQGKLRFSVDKRSGKKCYMLGATQIISWGDTSSLQMEWTSPADSRFSEVATIINATFLDIRARIQTQMLSPATTYAAYLVFRVATVYHGLEVVKATVRFVRHESDSEAEVKASLVHLKSRAYPSYDPMFLGGKIPRRRDDKWMEIEIGEFLTTTKGDCDGDDEVEARLFDNRQFYAKCGLIVDGVEFRPK